MDIGELADRIPPKIRLRVARFVGVNLEKIVKQTNKLWIPYKPRAGTIAHPPYQSACPNCDTDMFFDLVRVRSDQPSASNHCFQCGWSQRLGTTNIGTTIPGIEPFPPTIPTEQVGSWKEFPSRIEEYEIRIPTEGLVMTAPVGVSFPAGYEIPDFIKKVMKDKPLRTAFNNPHEPTSKKKGKKKKGKNKKGVKSSAKKK